MFNSSASVSFPTIALVKKNNLTRWDWNDFIFLLLETLPAISEKLALVGLRGVC